MQAGAQGARAETSPKAVLAVSCGSNEDTVTLLEGLSPELGSLEVALTNAPADAGCLRITLAGSRTDARTFPLTAANAVFRLKGAPVGTSSVVTNAFAPACDNLVTGLEPTWYSEPASVLTSANVVAHVAGKMIHNGQISVSVDFDDSNAPSTPPGPTPAAGVVSSRPA